MWGILYQELSFLLRSVAGMTTLDRECKFYFTENNIMVFFQLVAEFRIYLHIYACAGFFYRLIIHLHVLSLEIQFSKGKG
jgi:hypothetical protein